MKICFMAHFAMMPSKGGIQRVTTLLSRELSRRGHNICYLCYANYAKNDIDNPTIEFPQFYIDPADENVKDNLCRFMDEKGINCVINQEQDANSVKLLAMMPDTVKIVSVRHTMPFIYHGANRKSLWREFPSNTLKLTIHKTVALSFTRPFVNYKINKERKIFYQSLNYSDKFVFLSESFFPRVLHYVPDFPQKKLVAINNPNTFDATMSCDYESKKNIVLWVGRVDPNKNCMDFLKAWRLFSRNHAGWSAVVAGDGPELNRCKLWTKRHGISNVTFLGYYQEVAKLYDEAKILVSTSFKEGWPMVLNEAMSASCVPCVYNTFETIADILEDGVTGALCEPRPASLAAKLEELTSNGQRLKEMAMAGKISIRKFSVTHICDQWEKLLNSIM